MAPREVFISYSADDPDWPAAVVACLASDFQAAGLTVWLDQFHLAEKVIKPSDAAWREWMYKGLKSADHIICLCSEQYRTSMKTDKEIPAGRGVAFESVKFVQQIYNDKQHNDGWLLMVRHDHADRSVAELPQLEGVCPTYVFPGERKNLISGLGKLAKSGDPKAEPAVQVAVQAGGAAPAQSGAEGSSPQTKLDNQIELAKDQLRSAPEFWDSLKRDDFDGSRPVDLSHWNDAQFVDWLATAADLPPKRAMFAIHRALRAVRKDHAEPQCAEAAATALYLLAACRLVRSAAQEASKVIAVPDMDQAHLYCAVIVTALAGGKLEIVPSEDVAVPRAEFSYQIDLPAGDNPGVLFERALYAALFRTPEGVRQNLRDDELSKTERADLRAELEKIRSVDRSTLVLHIRTPTRTEDLSVAQVFQDLTVPVFVNAPDAVSGLVGMEPVDLVALIKLFWRELNGRAVNPPSSVAQASPLSQVVFNGPAMVNLTQQSGAPDWSQVLPLLESLVHLVGQQREDLRDKALTLVAAAKSGKTESKGIIRQGLEDIKSVADAVEGGQHLVSFVSSIMPMVMSYLK